MTLEIGNGWYFFYIGMAAICVAAGYFPMRKATKKAKFCFVFILACVNFAIHFLKLLLPEYADFPMSLRKCSPENICAVSVLIFPFLMFCKNKTVKDYLVFLGMIGGGIAVFVPTGAWGFAPFRAESIRFYLSHILLFMQAFYMLVFDIHRPHYSRFWRVPISLFIVLAIIALNEVILRATGFVGATLEELITNPAERNSVFIFGLTPEMESKVKFVTALVPEFMKHGFGYKSGDYYWPLLWLVFPLAIYGEILAHAIGFIWGWKDLKKDLKARKERLNCGPEV